MAIAQLDGLSVLIATECNRNAGTAVASLAKSMTRTLPENAPGMVSVICQQGTGVITSSEEMLSI